MSNLLLSSNVTDDELSKPVHGTTVPQNLIEKILRGRIYESQYWNEHCFGLTGEILIDKAVKLKYFGSVASESNKPTPFVCLLLKMLQMKLEFEVVQLMARSYDFKYMRVLASVYLRLTGSPFQIYSELEPLLRDSRKIRLHEKNGWKLTHVDEFIDILLTQPICMNIALPRLKHREHFTQLAPRLSIMAIKPKTVNGTTESGTQHENILNDIPAKSKKTKKKNKKKRKLLGLKLNNLNQPKHLKTEEDQPAPPEETPFDEEQWNSKRQALGLHALE